MKWRFAYMRVALPFLTSGSLGSYMVTVAEPNSPARDSHTPLGYRSPWPRREKTKEVAVKPLGPQLAPGAGNVEHGHESNGSLGDG